MKKVSEIVSDILVENGINDCFTLVGGGAMHLNDAFEWNEKINCTYFLHEQGATIAAEAYARVDGRLPVVCVTTGPGGTNTITGILCSWVDSVPMLVISGQVKTTNTIAYSGLNIRQNGEQECDIVSAVSSMTKYAVTVTDANMIRYHLEKAIYMASSGRRGPCLIDIPLDIQGKLIDETSLAGFEPEKEETECDYKQIIDVLKKAKRPALIAGSAVRTADAIAEFRNLARKLGLPVVVAKSIADIMPIGDPIYYGNFGVNGGRGGNFIVQNADCLLVIGCRMSYSHIGFNIKEFSPDSTKIVVDVDGEELKKNLINIDYPVNMDIKDFITGLAEEAASIDVNGEWIKYCNYLKEQFTIYQNKFADANNINAYYFVKKMYKHLSDDSICVVGNSCSAVAIKQYGIEKENQRMWGNVNCGTMGYDIPAAIGAAIAGGRRVVCCAGDGSFQLNIQELQTVKNYDLPIIFFVFNNGGYKSIILSQGKNFGRLSGCTEDSGLKLPELKKVAYLYDMPYYCCEKAEDLDDILNKVFAEKKSVICELIEDPNQCIEPKLGNKILEDGSIVSPTLTDLNPPLEEAEYKKLMNWFDE